MLVSSDGVLTKFIGYVFPKDGVVTIPEEVDGTTITTLGKKLFQGTCNIKKVILPRTLKSIEDFCFIDSSVEEVEFNSNIESIGSKAFARTKKLKTVVFNCVCDNLEFSPECFSNSSIKKIDLSNTQTKKITKRMFWTSEVENVKLPETVEVIDEEAFENCNSLLHINLKKLENLQHISAYAFHNVNLLNYDLIISEKIKVDSYAFAETNIKSVVIKPDSMSDYSNCFQNCKKLVDVYFYDSLHNYSIPKRMFFGCDSLSKIVIGQGCHTIGAAAFAYCNLTKLEIPESILNIEEEAFYGNPLTKNSIYLSMFAATIINSTAFTDSKIATRLQQSKNPFIQIV